jgi:GntR family transcriptional regulator
VISFKRDTATALDAERVGAVPGEPVWRLVRVRLLSGTPMMVERTTFPNHVGVHVAAVDLERESIYEQLARLGIVFARARHTVEAIAATAEDARLLEVARSAPILRELRSTASFDGSPLEWSDDRYRGDAVSFALENSAPAGGAFGRHLVESG